MIATLAAVAAAGVAAWGAVYRATYAVRSQWLGPTDWRGPAESGAVALTFDDGPSEDTPRVLDALAETGAPATFFAVGRHVEARPEAARRVVAAGHEIGNHSYSHPIYLYRTPAETARQLRRAQDAIADATGVRPRLARPPCGVRTPAYFRTAGELGLRTVQWDVAGFDWLRRSPERIAGDVLSNVRAGSIVLLHDGDGAGRDDRRATAAAVPLVVAGLAARGLRVAPLAELLGLSLAATTTKESLS